MGSGHLFPLDILPPAVAMALNFTPFPYQLFFPVSVYLGRVTGPELWQGLAVQFFWVTFFYWLARWAWNRGIRRYTAFGG
jgi:ABC-2 type transport system permease protein